MTDAPAISEELQVNLGTITFKELMQAVHAFKPNKACGPDMQPIEYWKVILENGSKEAVDWLLLLCNSAWELKEMPQSWHLSRVVCIFKKGDPGDCKNYRPICLLNAAYKIFAMIVFRRLKDAGADACIQASQFGFRPKRSTEDALHCARRAVERAFADRGGCLHLLALDWQMAFDSINPAAMINALRRFGLPPHICQVVQAIYSERHFRVSDTGQTSAEHLQFSGICQGCPLSPFLFVMVMTVLMHDAVANLEPAAAEAYRAGRLYDLLYADDTLILGTNAQDIAQFAAVVERMGANYGMSLHWGKTQALSILSADRILQPDGSPMTEVSEMKYLGAVLDGHGRSDSEISRKLGCAKGAFRELSKLWSHAAVTTKDKLRFSTP